MNKIKTKNTSLFALSLAALIVTGCNPDKDPDDGDGKGGDFYEDNGWELVWSDEFDGTTLDTSKWAYEVNCWGGGNAESQCYVEDPDNVFVDDGILTIKAIRESSTGAIYNPDDPRYDPAQMNTKDFTSGRLRSVSPMDYVEGQDTDFHFRNDWKYGRIEIRAKVPEGQGTWAAAWMLPTDWAFGGWAMSGEIDILEAVNIGAQSDRDDAEPGETEQRVYGTLHYGRAWPGNEYSGEYYNEIRPADDFHTYTIEWEEGAIRWFVDDVHYATQTQEGWYTHYQDENGDWQSSGTTAAPFNQNFHIILNLAMGGNWAGNVNEGGIDATISEADYLVDYVRVYQCEDDASGVSCGTKGEEGTYALNSGVVEPLLPVAADFTADPLVIFDDLLVADWQLAKWDDADGGDEYEVVEATDTEDGYIDLQFDNTGVMYLYANEGKLSDFSNFAGDYTFKMRWVSGTATGLKVGINDNAGNFAHIVLDQQYFGSQGASEWTDVTISVSDMIANAAAIDLSNIEIAGKFEQSGGTDLHVQIKDIAISQGTYVEPEPEPLGETLSLLADAVSEGFEAQLYHGYNEAATDVLTVTGGLMNGNHEGGGNISLASTTGALDLTDFTLGSMNFELRIVELGSTTDVLVKMSNASWPHVGDVALSETTTGLPTVGEWATFSIPVQAFIDNDNRLDGSGVFDITAVTTPFVVESIGGGLEVEVRNVSLSKPLNVLTTAVDEGFEAQLYHGYNEAATDVLTVTGGVMNGNHDGGGNISLASTTGALDFSEYVLGEMTFDLRILDFGTTTDVLVKMSNASWPHVGDVALSETAAGFPANNNWVSYAVPVQSFIDNDNRLDGSGVFDITAVTTPFVIESIGGGLEVEVQNVRFRK